MSDCTFLPPDACHRLFSESTGHVPVRITALARPRLLWLNRRVMHRDPHFAMAADEPAYVQALLHRCAHVLAGTGAAPVDEGRPGEAIADRYGGTGIGRNGGSGRAVYLDGYHIKGIGRTPLVSRLTDTAHASGGAYLEECVREAVMSELVDAEFPYGAVPVLAVIETGQLEVWQTDAGPKPERRCLLVRPAFLRPAHFTRAVEFMGPRPTEGALDAKRVALTTRAAVEHFGASGFPQVWQRFWLRWAEQLAYGFIHRLNHGGNTESNIALDARLLDFGAMTALPSWARAQLMQGGAPAGADLLFLVQALQAVTPLLGRHADASMADPHRLQAMAAQIADRYRLALSREVLRVAGLSRAQACTLLKCEQSGRVLAAINRLVGHFLREQFSVFDGMPEPRIAWDLDRLWDPVPPPHLAELRATLAASLATLPTEALTPAQRQQVIAARNRLRSRTRSGLFRDRIKADLYAALDGRYEGDLLTEAHVAHVIDEQVLRHRRDALIEPEDALPLGFARSPDAGYALHRNVRDGRLRAVLEWQSGGAAELVGQAFDVTAMAGETVTFADPSRAPALASGWAASPAIDSHKAPAKQASAEAPTM
jgi:hypothetical protein